MAYRSSTVIPRAQEAPFRYSSSKENFAYEISLRTASSSPWLKELPSAHHLVQVLLKGQLLGKYELLDFLIWPHGVFTRISLKGSFSLSEFLAFVKEKPAPGGGVVGEPWDDEIQWIKLIPPEKLHDSTENFLRTAEQIRTGLLSSNGVLPGLFFFDRNSRPSQ